MVKGGVHTTIYHIPIIDTIRRDLVPRTQRLSEAKIFILHGNFYKVLAVNTQNVVFFETNILEKHECEFRNLA